MKWLTNIHKDDINDNDKWLNGKVISDPKSTNEHTVDELKKLNMVGVYKKKSRSFMK